MATAAEAAPGSAEGVPPSGTQPNNQENQDPDGKEGLRTLFFEGQNKIGVHKYVETTINQSKLPDDFYNRVTRPSSRRNSN